MFRRQFIALLSAVCIITFQTGGPLVVSAREVSKAGQVFKDVKDGVVTIVSAASGTGFLVDESGLILTNSHVVRYAGEHLRVRFDNDYIVHGIVVENDRDADIAFVLVDLKNIPNYKVLKLFTPQQGEGLVEIGEKIVVIGSPLSWETNEKSLTEGIIRHFEGDVIHHDANTHPGNSGGPVLNYDGEVVGIHSFAQTSPHGGNIPGAVAVSKAYALIEKVKNKKSTYVKPSPELLPDIPRLAFPINEILRNQPEKLPKKVFPYHINSSYFSMALMTPPLGKRKKLAYDNLLLDKRKKRAKKKGFEISEDEYDSKKDLKFYNYEKPVVSLFVIPNPKLTTGSKVFNTVTFLGATALTVASFGLAAPTMVLPFVMGKKEVKKDFLKMKMRTKDKELACLPYQSGLQPYNEPYRYLTDYSYEEFIDKTYMGVYEFDARCFDTVKTLEFVVYTEGDKKALQITIPQKIKDNIVRDFKPYWEYAATKQNVVIADKSKIWVKNTEDKDTIEEDITVAEKEPVGTPETTSQPAAVPVNNSDSMPEVPTQETPVNLAP